MEEHLDLAGLAAPPSGDPSSISMVVFTLSKAGTGQGCVCENHSSSAAEIYGGSSFDGRQADSEDRGSCSQLLLGLGQKTSFYPVSTAHGRYR